MSYIGVAGAAASLLGGVGKSLLGGSSKKKALKAKQNALLSLEALDIDELKKLAETTDIERYRKQFEAQSDVDPTYAALRERGGQNLLRYLMEDLSGQSQADKAVNELSAELKSDKAKTEPLIEALLDRAAADLEAGATLPPEFQAELVKSGLEGAGKGGLSIEGRGAAGSGIRRLLGSEGLALKEAREQSARTNMTAAETLRANRQAKLSELAQLDASFRDRKAARAGAGASIGNNVVPAIGLTGADAAKMSMTNTDFENQRKMALAGVKADKVLAKGAMFSELLGSGVGFLSSGLSTDPKTGAANGFLKGLF